MLQQSDLTADEQKLDAVWSEHLRAEFSSHSADETIVTMSANPLINQVPVMIGGDGREEVYEFYTKYFLKSGGFVIIAGGKALPSGSPVYFDDNGVYQPVIPSVKACIIGSDPKAARNLALAHRSGSDPVTGHHNLVSVIVRPAVTEECRRH